MTIHDHEARVREAVNLAYRTLRDDGRDDESARDEVEGWVTTELGIAEDEHDEEARS